jgi:hypothetical protein
LSSKCPSPNLIAVTRRRFARFRRRGPGWVTQERRSASWRNWSAAGGGGPGT